MPVDLKTILDNSPEEIQVEGYGSVKVRLPTIEEKLEAKSEVKKIPHYDSLSEVEKVYYEACIIAMKCLVEPRISLEDFLKAPDLKITRILNAVSFWYASKQKEINEEFRRQLSFLQEETRT